MGKQTDQTNSATGSTEATESPLAVASRKVDAAIAKARAASSELVRGREIVAQMERAHDLAKIDLDLAKAEWLKLVDAGRKA